ncbi:MAG TPA: bi-domain-containing oxidoreductase [Longimicrobium sp.]|jgi:predicted dehydrogenase/threonine dehydrogenase-like Zn-dependent dehydrogenase
MKQLLQRFDTGKTVLADTPVPAVSGPTLLVRSSASLISAGTERMLVDFGRASLIQKARQQPDKVRQVLDKMSTDGIGPTLEAVRSKLEAPIPLGYCNAGIVVETGSRVTRFAAGDRVVTNGSHAEYVRVPHTLAARVPDGVSLEAAAFTPVAAIGLQGIRLAAPTLGETVVVYGLGLIGLLTVQLLRASGCRVIGIDRNAERLALAERFGAVALNGAEGDVVTRVEALTGGVGADAVLLTLASDSDEPVHQAAAMSRKRGRLVLVGVTGLDLRRDDFYRKELTLAVSCSYGPGRYDPEYEEGGRDYPVGYVRWTEQRNFEAVLAMMESGAVDPLPLVTHRFAFDDAADAYDLLTGGGSSLGVVLQYPEADGAPARESRTVERTPAAPATGDGAAVIGAGNFAVRTLLPALKAEGARLRTIASGAGTSAAIAAEKFAFERTTTDLDAVFGDEQVSNVYVLTRHDSHASLAVRALQAGKHVFVEKPLALDEAGLDAVEAAARASGRMVMVGFNRRFAPLTSEVRGLLRGRSGPLTVVATVNAGAIPRDHWTQDPEAGGGRIVGEAVHWMDLARALVDAPIRGVSVVVAHDRAGLPVDDIAHVSLSFADGSTALIHYLASGARAYPKERIECFWDGKTVAIQNWRRLERFGVPGPWFERSRTSDKGHAAEVRAWTEALRRGADAPIPLDEVLEVSRWGVRAAELARGGGGVYRPSGD